MNNPFNTLNPNNPYNSNNMAGIRNIYQLMQNGNPMQVFQQFAQQNPRLQPVMQMLRNGGDPQQIFYNICNQRGINPQQFLNSITGKNAF